jgi:hypothetical protein
VQVVALAAPELLLEIDAMAIVKDQPAREGQSS